MIYENQILIPVEYILNYHLYHKNLIDEDTYLKVEEILLKKLKEEKYDVS